MDVYRVERIDKDGLKVYVTDWGTNLNETLHQKYADLVGPYSVGMKSADLLLVLRSFGILPWPTHKNLLDFLPPSDSTVVGLRPLRFDPNHVRYSETPATKLSNDHYYLSKKLGLAIAPLPVCTKDEFMLYNSELKTIFEQGRNPNINDWNAMACKFLQEAMSEQKQIYPKTVDHLKKHFTSWKHNQRIKLFGKQLNLASNPLMKTLREQSTTKSPTIQTQNLPKQVTHLSRPLEAMPNYVPPKKN